MTGGADSPGFGPDTWGEESAATPASGADLGLDPPRPGGAPAGGSSDEGTPRTFQHPELHRYELHGELGRGGMGRVLSARDQRLGREVAVKQLREGRDPRRMAREARITARLEHPGIVPIYDASTDAQGRPFYTMRLLRGRSLAQVLEETPDLEARLRLLRRVLDVCEAVAYAHSRGVVHRDLKPANIMLGAFGETQVVDWGLARLEGDELDPSDAGRTTMAAGVTHEGAVLGTPSYMSPEQARGERGDERSDVWSLGVLLYELVTGTPPFVGPSSDEVLHQLRLRKVPHLREPPELAAIVNRALQRDAEHRYPDAEALSQDLAAYLDGRRVDAYAYSGLELAGRLARAWRTPLLMAGLALLVVGGVILAAVQRTAQERDRALSAESTTRAEKVRADEALGRALLAQARVAQGQGARAQAEVLAVSALTLGESPEARGLLASFGVQERPRRGAVSDLPECDLRWVGPRAEWMLCARDSSLSWWTGEPLEERWSRVIVADRLDVSEDGSSIWTVGGGKARRYATIDGSVAGGDLSEAPNWPLDATPDGSGVWFHTSYNEAAYGAGVVEGKGSVERLRICDPGLPHPVTGDGPEGDHVVLCQDGVMAVFRGEEFQRGSTHPLLTGKLGPSSVALLAGGVQAVVGTLDGEVVLVDLGTGRTLRQEHPGLGLIEQIEVSPDGGLAAILGERDMVVLWDLGTGALLARIPFGGETLRFRDDETLVILGDRQVSWTLPRDARPTTFAGGSGTTSARLHPDGHTLATTHGSGELKVWDTASGALRETRSWEEGVLKGGAFSPDGQRFVAGGLGVHDLAIFDTETWTQDRSRQPTSGWHGRRVGFLGADTIIGLSFGDIVRLVSPIGELERVPTGKAWDLDRAPDTGSVLLATAQGIRLLGEGVDKVVIPTVAAFVALAPGDAQLAVTGEDGIGLYSPDGELLRTLPSRGGKVFDLAYSPDDRFLAAGDYQGNVWIWSRAEDMRLVGRLRGHRARVASVEFSSDSSLLVTGSWDDTARIWDLSVLDAEPQALADRVLDDWALDLDAVLAGGM